MTDLALDLQGLAATRGEAEAAAVAETVAGLAEAHAARRRANCLGYESQAREPGPVRGERLPRADETRVVWVGHGQVGKATWRRMGCGKLPPGARYWTVVGSDHWVRVPGS